MLRSIYLVKNKIIVRFLTSRVLNLYKGKVHLTAYICISITGTNFPGIMSIISGCVNYVWATIAYY